jgi:hypothetical protein
LRKLLFITLVVLAAATPMSATTFIVPDDAELVQKSEGIITGVVVSARVAEIESGYIETFYEIALDRVLKGPFRPKTRITIQSPGGVIGTRFMFAESAAHFQIGDEVLLFLTPHRGGWTTTDLTLGKFKFAVTSGGHSVVVRDAADIAGWDRQGNVHREKIRRDAEFLQFIEETVAGSTPMVRDYAADPSEVLAPPPSAPPARRQPVAELFPAPSHTYSAGIYDCSGTRYPMRWETGTMNAGVQWRKNSSQNASGVPDGGVSIIQNGLNAWTSDCESSINIQYGGTTTSLKNSADQENVVVFNDPGNHVPGTFSGSGIIAMCFPVGNVTHTFDDVEFVSIDDADVVFNNGYSGTGLAIEEAMTHELGHGIGFRHSDRHYLSTCTIQNCFPMCSETACDPNVEDCSDSAIMKTSVINTLGYNLQTWDRRAADALYPGTCIVLTAPANVVATATTESNVNVTWTSVEGASTYNVYRSTDGTHYSLAGSTTAPTLTFNDAARSSNTAFLYKVRAVNGTEGPDSNADLATTVIFTDDPLIAGTAIKAVHIAELRTAVDAVRTLAGLSAGTYTDPTLTPGVTSVKSVHVTELRTALDAARAALGLSGLSYADSLTAGTPVKATHLSELRNGVK